MDHIKIFKTQNKPLYHTDSSGIWNSGKLVHHSDAFKLAHQLGTFHNFGEFPFRAAHSSEIEHLFQSYSNTRSNPFRTVIPIESEHRFQMKANAFRGGFGVA
jgi:hypothetical protein